MGSFHLPAGPADENKMHVACIVQRNHPPQHKSTSSAREAYSRCLKWNHDHLYTLTSPLHANGNPCWRHISKSAMRANFQAVLLLATVISQLQHCAASCELVFDRDLPGFSPQSLGLPPSNFTRLFKKVLRSKGKPGYMVLPYVWEPQSVQLECGSLLSVSHAPGLSPLCMCLRLPPTQAAKCAFLPGPCACSTPFTLRHQRRSCCRPKPTGRPHGVASRA